MTDLSIPSTKRLTEKALNESSCRSYIQDSYQIATFCKKPLKMGLLRERLRSFRHAFNGILVLVLDEANARIHLTATLLTITLGIYFGIGPLEWAAISLCCGLVIGLEALNAAVEELADHVSAEKHERVQKLKDLCAGSVLVAAIAATGVAALIFIPKIW